MTMNRFIELNMALSLLGRGTSTPFGQDFAHLLASDPKLGERLRQALEDDPDAISRFERALAGLEGKHPQAAKPADDGPQVPPEPARQPQAHRDAVRDLPSPLTLFGAPHVAPVAAVTEAATAQEELSSHLREVVAHLMVGDGRSGGRQVRMDLQDEVLPGVTVVIEEQQGRLQVDFLCRQEPSRLRLVAAAPEQAPQMAQYLRRDVLLRVQRDDDADPRPFEVAANA